MRATKARLPEFTGQEGLGSAYRRVQQEVAEGSLPGLFATAESSDGTSRDSAAAEAPTVRFAAAASDEEYDALLARHSELALKLIQGQLSGQERLELPMVRWAIDRADNARVMPQLQNLERLVELHEGLQLEIDRLVRAISG